jgi:UPF0042 nucleotide-binding protein
MDRGHAKVLKLSIFSFGFKHGVPVDASVLLDVRFLPNPYWEERLRPLSGRDPEIVSFVVDSEPGARFLSLLEPLLSFIGDQLKAGAKRELRIGIGCTGGRHRSVAVVEALAGMFVGRVDVDVDIFHRDIGKR